MYVRENGNRPAATNSRAALSRRLHAGALKSFISIAHPHPVVYALLPDMTPTARHVLWPSIVAVHHIAQRDPAKANRLLKAIVAAADKPSFYGGRHVAK